MVKQRLDCERAIQQYQTHLAALISRLTELKRWFAHLEAHDQANPVSPVCEVCMDGGLNSGGQVASLIETGYRANKKVLRRRLKAKTRWMHVGANTEITEPIEY